MRVTHHPGANVIIEPLICNQAAATKKNVSRESSRADAIGKSINPPPRRSDRAKECAHIKSKWCCFFLSLKQIHYITGAFPAPGSVPARGRPQVHFCGCKIANFFSFPTFFYIVVCFLLPSAHVRHTLMIFCCFWLQVLLFASSKSKAKALSPLWSQAVFECPSERRRELHRHVRG